MKRLTTVLGVTGLVAALAVPVFAWGPGWGRGHHMMGSWGSAPGYGWDEERGYSDLTQEQRTRLGQLERKFYDETAKLRNELWAKDRELDALLSGANPDLQTAKALQRDINDLRAKLEEKGLEYELEARKAAPDGRLAGGYGSPMMGPGAGYGPGSCRD